MLSGLCGFPRSLQENSCIVRRVWHSHPLQPTNHQQAGYRHHSDVLRLWINHTRIQLSVKKNQKFWEGPRRTLLSYTKMLKIDQLAPTIPFNTFSVRKNDKSCLRINDCSSDCDCRECNVFRSRTVTWTRHVARMGERRGADRVSVGKPEAKRPLGRPRRWWEYNIKVNLQEIRWWGVEWIDLAQDRDTRRGFVNEVTINFRYVKSVGNFFIRWGTINFPRTRAPRGVSSHVICKVPTVVARSSAIWHRAVWLVYTNAS